MIKYQIISSSGIDVREKEVKEALADILENAEKHNLWLYLDDAPMSPKTVTAEMLGAAQMIVLTHTIQGG